MYVLIRTLCITEWSLLNIQHFCRIKLTHWCLDNGDSTYSPVILWLNPKLISTQTISTVSSTKKYALQHIKSSGKSQWGKVISHMTFLAIFSKFQGFLVLFPLCIILTIQIWYQIIGLTIRSKLTLVWCL